MVTIFISITRGLVARNLLRTDVFAILRKQSDIKFVFLVLDKAMEEFKKEFYGDNIEALPITSPKTSRARSWFLKLFSRTLVWTDSAKILSFVGKFSDKNRNSFFYKALFNSIGFLGRFKVVNGFYRWIEFYFFPEKNYDHLFKDRKIDLIFLPDIQGKIDTALLKSAKRFKVKSVAMTKGWDTLCQRLLRAVPDKIIVQSPSVKFDAEHYQHMQEKSIFVSGFPQFDFYVKKDWILSREEFCRRMNFDPSRAILFFGSSGAWTNHDHELLEKICGCIKNDSFIKPCSLIIRPHFSNVLQKPYADFNNQLNIFIDDKYTLSNFIDNWNPGEEDNKMLVNNLYHSDIMISYFSTLALDAAVFDKPIINMAFGGQFDPEGNDVTIRLMQRTHYQPIVKTGGVRPVYNFEELRQMIDEYLKNPKLDSEGRKILRDNWCYGADGLSGKRVAEFILNELNLNK